MTTRKCLVVSLLALASLGLACTKSDANAAPAAKETGVAEAPKPVEGRLVEVTADLEGYAPKEIAAKAGETLTLRFVRKVDSSCLEEVVFPALSIKRELPVGKPVDIVIKADKPGEIKFQCGMAMLFGKIVVS